MSTNNKKITKKMIINVLIFSSILGIIAGIIEQFEQDIERKKHPENIPYLNHIYEKFIKRPDTGAADCEYCIIRSHDDQCGGHQQEDGSYDRQCRRSDES